MVQLSYLYVTTGKTIALTIEDSVISGFKDISPHFAWCCTIETGKGVEDTGPILKELFPQAIQQGENNCFPNCVAGKL